jgi:hypothetical protein
MIIFLLLAAFRMLRISTIKVVAGAHPRAGENHEMTCLQRREQEIQELTQSDSLRKRCACLSCLRACVPWQAGGKGRFFFLCAENQKYKILVVNEL